MTQPTLIERFADNGEHSHWELVDTETHETLWSGDSATPPPQGLAWVNIVKGDLSTLPKDEEEYLFDSDGYETGCPMWGRIAYNGKLPSLKTLDSSGEDEYHDIWEFSRWLTAPAPQTDAVEKASVPDFGICKEKGCKEKATVDYNGHGYFVCKMHYKLLNDEFDEEYK